MEELNMVKNLYLGMDGERPVGFSVVEDAVLDLEDAEWRDDLYDCSSFTKGIWEKVENTTNLRHCNSYRTIEEMEEQDAKMDYLDDEDLKKFIEVHQQLNRQIKQWFS